MFKRVMTMGLALTAAVCAADYAQWMGPSRNAVIEKSPALIDSIPEKGLEPVWASADAIPGAGQGGYGSVVVADGRVYVFSNSKYKVPFDTRALTAKALEELGWSKDMPQALADLVEAARLSKDRADKKGRELNDWMKSWLKENISKENKAFYRASFNRLRAGAKAVAADVARKLEPIVDKTFPTQAELDKWFQENQVAGDARKLVMRAIPTHTPKAHDEIFCLDAATGKTLWKQRMEGRHHTYSSSSTPCVANGRVYVAGSESTAYCLDAKTGEMVWRAKTPAKPNKNQSSSFIVLDGKAVLLAGVLVAYDAETGKELWKQTQVRGEYSSAAMWKREGKTYLVCNGSGVTVCVDPATGDPLWKTPGGGWSTPTIVGDRMAIFTNNKRVGLAAYRLSLKGAEEIWKIDFTDRGSSPVIWGGYAYAFGGRNKGRGLCVELETGKVAWDEKLKNTEIQSPLAADGKIWVAVGMGKATLHCIKADPAKYTPLGELKANVALCTMPALADGLFYLRTPDRVVCYDLRK